jgi:hypothetical protein
VVLALQNAENGIEYTRPDGEPSACVEAATAPEHAHTAAQMTLTEVRIRTFLPRFPRPPLAAAPAEIANRSGLARVGEAYERFAAGGKLGKIVLRAVEVRRSLI